jgi:hypothetical protein
LQLLLLFLSDPPEDRSPLFNRESSADRVSPSVLLFVCLFYVLHFILFAFVVVVIRPFQSLILLEVSKDAQTLDKLCNDLCTACWNNEVTAVKALLQDTDAKLFINAFNARGILSVSVLVELELELVSGFWGFF